MKQIELTKGKFALVDDDYFNELNKFNWHASGKNGRFYALKKHNNSRGKISMHRLITKCPDNLEVDHIDGDGLNNQRSNLRICTHLQNHRNSRKQKSNTSGYKGVYFDNNMQKYRARIRISNGKRMDLGYYNKAIDAAVAYDSAAIVFHKEFANLNFQK